MERCSFFIPDKALFGSFPTQEAVEELEKRGVRYFVDLTDNNEEKTVPYQTVYRYIKYPIPDRKIPENWKTFAQLILEICKVILNSGSEELVYIHCRGGHGRSGVLVACVLCQYYGITPDEALRQTAKYHSNRKEMREKWRRLGSPQGKRQKDFVHRFFRVLKYDKPVQNNFTLGLNNFTNHPVEIPGLGKFPNAHLAFQSFRAPDNPEYIKLLLEGKFCPEYVAEHNREWEEKKVEHMYTVLEYKFRQHPDLQKFLMNTGLRPLVKCSYDTFWGDGGNGHGRNMHGKLLVKLRNTFLHEDFEKNRE